MSRSRSVRHRGVDAARRHRFAIEDAVEDHRRRVAGETLPAGRHLVEHDAEREQVGARIEILAARLLGRHVGDGADGGADHAGEVLRRGFPGRRRFRLRRRRVGGELGQAEVEHLHLAAPGDEDVRGLDVAVKDALAVRRVQRIGNLRADVEQGAEVERPSAQPLVERLALEQLHRQIALSLVLVEAVDRADVGMVQATRRCGLRAGTARWLRSVASLPVGQDLDGHLTPELHVLSAIDDAHAAGAELIEDAVVPEILTDEGTGHDKRTANRKPDKP